MLTEFRKFAMRGNVVDMAVGIVIGGAFGAIVASLVNDLLMPAIGLLVGGEAFTNLFLVLKEGATPGPYPSLAIAREAGAVTLGFGAFVNTIVNFIIVAFALFLLVRGMNRLRHQEAAAPAPPPAPTMEEKLLTEIRDLLARR